MAQDIQTVDNFVALAKRQFGIGEVSNTSDRSTVDIVSYINIEMLRIWQMRNWLWSLVEISKSFSSADIVFDGAGAESLLGQIEILWIDGEDDYLIPMTFKEWVRWRKSATDETNVPTRYVKTGRSTQGVGLGSLKIKLVPTPKDAGTLKGFGKRRLPSVAVSDIASASPFAYFPNEVLGVIFDYVGVRILRSLDKTTEAAILLEQAKNALKDLIAGDTNQPDEEIQAPPPDFIRWRNQKRNAGGVV